MERMFLRKQSEDVTAPTVPSSSPRSLSAFTVETSWTGPVLFSFRLEPHLYLQAGHFPHWYTSFPFDCLLTSLARYQWGWLPERPTHYSLPHHLQTWAVTGLCETEMSLKAEEWTSVSVSTSELRAYQRSVGPTAVKCNEADGKPF